MALINGHLTLLYTLTVVYFYTLCYDVYLIQCEYIFRFMIDNKDFMRLLEQ